VFNPQLNICVFTIFLELFPSQCQLLNPSFAETALKFYIATASWLVQVVIAQEDLDDMSYSEPTLATQFEVSSLHT
jgi:hypothetical protein